MSCLSFLVFLICIFSFSLISLTESLYFIDLLREPDFAFYRKFVLFFFSISLISAVVFFLLLTSDVI